MAVTGRPVAQVTIGKGLDVAAVDAVFSSNGEDVTLTTIHEDIPEASFLAAAEKFGAAPYR